MWYYNPQTSLHCVDVSKTISACRYWWKLVFFNNQIIFILIFVTRIFAMIYLVKEALNLANEIQVFLFCLPHLLLHLRNNESKESSVCWYGYSKLSINDFLYNPEAAKHASKRIILFTASGEVERGPSPTLLSSQTYKDIAMLVGLYIMNF